MTEHDQPVQHEQDGPRVIDLSVEVPGTPEEVWHAVATGPGISSWFIPHSVAEHEGGTVTMDFGSSFGKETATVESWDPPHRVVFVGPGEQPLAYEWLVEARNGGTCVVRLVNSGFGSGADWDGQYDGMTQGWQLFMENLRLHLTHFRGQRAEPVIPVGMAPGPNQTAFDELCLALGISADLQAGDRLVTSGDGVPPLAGTCRRSSGQRKSRRTSCCSTVPPPARRSSPPRATASRSACVPTSTCTAATPRRSAADGRRSWPSGSPCRSPRKPEARYQRSADSLRSRTSCVSRQAIAPRVKARPT